MIYYINYINYINYKDKTYTATATMNRVPPIDGLDYDYDSVEEEYEILLFSQEPAGEGDFYLFKTFKNGTAMGDTLRHTEFVEDEAAFEAIKSSALRVGDVKTFQGFILDVPAGVDVNQYNTVLVWCEAFGEFITAGKYR